MAAVGRDAHRKDERRAFATSRHHTTVDALAEHRRRVEQSRVRRDSVERAARIARIEPATSVYYSRVVALLMIAVRVW